MKSPKCHGKFMELKALADPIEHMDKAIMRAYFQCRKCGEVTRVNVV